MTVSRLLRNGLCVSRPPTAHVKNPYERCSKPAAPRTLQRFCSHLYPTWRIFQSSQDTQFLTATLSLNVPTSAEAFLSLQFSVIAPFSTSCLAYKYQLTYLLLPDHSCLSATLQASEDRVRPIFSVSESRYLVHCLETAPVAAE